MAIKHSRDEPDYHSADYWNSRYKGGAMSNFAWYCGLDALKPLLSPLLADASSVLEIGCGDCPLARELRADGFAGELVAVDYAAACVRELRAEQQRRPPAARVRYDEADARALAYRAASFDLVLDKGTVDATLSSAAVGVRDAAAIAREAVRVLRVGGERGAAAGCAALVVVSHCQPDDEHGEVLVHDVLAPALRAARGAPHWDVAAHVCGDDSACCYVARARARPHATRARARGEQPGRATFRVLAHGDSDDDDDDDDP